LSEVLGGLAGGVGVFLDPMSQGPYELHFFESPAHRGEEEGQVPPPRLRGARGGRRVRDTKGGPGGVSTTAEAAALSRLMANWRTLVEETRMSAGERQERRKGQRHFEIEKEARRS
jgi:hypothetical protein